MTYYPPLYVNAIESVDNLVSCVHNVMKFWYDVHTDADAFVHEWLQLDDQSALVAYENGVSLSNGYFNFDWRHEALRLTSIAFDAGMFEQCSICGSLNAWAYDRCDCDGADFSNPSQEDLLDWLFAVEYIPSEEFLLEAAIGGGFEAYKEAIHPIIVDILSEVKLVLNHFNNAETNMEALSCMMASLGIMHHSGNICEDYGDRLGLSYNDVCSVREEGIVSLFTSEEVKEYLNGD